MRYFGRMSTLIIICVLIVGFTAFPNVKAKEYSNTVFSDLPEEYSIEDWVEKGDIVWQHTVVNMPEHISEESDSVSWSFDVKNRYQYNDDVQIAFYDNKEDAKNNNLANAKEVWKDNDYYTEECVNWWGFIHSRINLVLDSKQLNKNNWAYMVISFSTTYTADSRADRTETPIIGENEEILYQFGNAFYACCVLISIIIFIRLIERFLGFLYKKSEDSVEQTSYIKKDYL